MKEQIKISLLQTDILWEDANANRNHIEVLIKNISHTHIVVLPEMFTTGFSMNPKPLAETMSGSTINWLKHLSKQQDLAICGSLIIEENNCFYNRFVFVEPSGNIQHYDKRHLFTLAGEHHTYTSGQQLIDINYKGWKIKPLICYDLRFPVWSRNTSDYDLLIYVANWPGQRIEAWNSLLKARAIENMCYTIGANRVGVDPNGNKYNGSSKAFNFMGEELFDIPLNKEASVTINLDPDALNKVRTQLNFLNDRDQFTIT